MTSAALGLSLTGSEQAILCGIMAELVKKGPEITMLDLLKVTRPAIAQAEAAMKERCAEVASLYMPATHHGRSIADKIREIK